MGISELQLYGKVTLPSTCYFMVILLLTLLIDRYKEIFALSLSYANNIIMIDDDCSKFAKFWYSLSVQLKINNLSELNSFV